MNMRSEIWDSALKSIRVDRAIARVQPISGANFVSQLPTQSPYNLFLESKNRS